MSPGHKHTCCLQHDCCDCFFDMACTDFTCVLVDTKIKQISSTSQERPFNSSILIPSSILRFFNLSAWVIRAKRSNFAMHPGRAFNLSHCSLNRRSLRYCSSVRVRRNAMIAFFSSAVNSNPNVPSCFSSGSNVGVSCMPVE